MTEIEEVQIEEVPIMAQEIKPHPGTEDFAECFPCRLGDRHAKADVIVSTTWEGNGKFIRGMCAHHAELLEPLRKQEETL